MTEQLSNGIQDNKKHWMYFFIVWGLLIIAFRWQEIINPLYLYWDVSIHYLFHIIPHYDVFNDDLFFQFIWKKIHIRELYYLYVWAFNWFYGLGIFTINFLSPLYYLKIWIFVQNFLSCLFIYIIFSKKKQYLQGLFAVLSFEILFFSMDTFQGGIPRGFGGVLTCIFTCFFIFDKIKACIITLFCTVFLYPQILPFMFTAIFFEWVIIKNNIRKNRAILLIIFSLILLFYLKKVPIYESDVFNDEFSRIGYSTYKSSVYISSYNYLRKIGDIFINYILNNDDHPGKEFGFILFSYFIILLVPLSRRKLKYYILSDVFEKNLRLLTYSLLSFGIVSALSLYIHPSNFILHVAGKQTKFFLPLFMSMTFGMFCFRLFRKKLLFFLILFFTAVSVYFAFPHKYNVDLSGYSPVYNYISKMPENSMIAGKWADVEFIPFLAERKVFSMHIWSDLSADAEFYIEQKRRKELLDSLSFYRDINSIMEIVKREKITHLFINKNDPLINKKFLNALISNEPEISKHLKIEYVLNSLYLIKII